MATVTLEQLEADPHPALAQLRPIAWVPVLTGWLVTGRELALRSSFATRKGNVAAVERTRG